MMTWVYIAVIWVLVDVLFCMAWSRFCDWRRENGWF